MWQVCIFKLFFTFISFSVRFRSSLDRSQFCFHLKMLKCFILVSFLLILTLGLVIFNWNCMEGVCQEVWFRKIRTGVTFWKLLLEAVDSQSRHPDSQQTRPSKPHQPSCDNYYHKWINSKTTKSFLLVWIFSKSLVFHFYFRIKQCFLYLILVFGFISVNYNNLDGSRTGQAEEGKGKKSQL